MTDSKNRGQITVPPPYLRRNPLTRQVTHVGAQACMFEVDRADVALGSHIHVSVLVEIPGFGDVIGAEFDVQGIGSSKYCAFISLYLRRQLTQHFRMPQRNEQ